MQACTGKFIRQVQILYDVSLILSVLQILLDVAQRANELKENSGVPPSIVLNMRINDNDKSIASIGNVFFYVFCTPYYFFKCIMSLIFVLFTDIYSTQFGEQGLSQVLFSAV